ncbi:hypothetical protein BCR33DRAFT_719617 [Rhizoclosmatium globosum]|uniref:P-loop containing nucleoside triphosphate hydrolase protein n=1 Tax=Rhizoclosmatium globosum TaxID=329046 RepID=A0A1Y2BZS1_9FUNG|nr:hypothetical protein BCR33DRAFT_719617 [Rhizoclosmatium globosum]|eukprot:ORY40261.1 hypothetical protein BCR33DRAFT_719617 [Rhizoclosmatium globosum]
MEYIVSNPSIQDVKIKSPLVVLGLPRSGTTLIHRLLACDPVARGFKTFEMLASLGSDLVPPPNKTNYTNHRNITTIEKGMTRLELLFPNWLSEYRESHFTAADEYEEEVLIAMHQGYNFVNHPAVLEMYRNQSYMLQVYVYMKRYIQMLVSGFTNVSHIVLKSPIHSDSLHALLSVFPDARVVIMNRSSTQVVPSATLLTSRMISSKIKPGKIDAREFGQQTLDRMVSMHKSIVTFCGLVAARQVKLMPNVATDPPMKDHQVSASQFINVEYDDLVTRPVETVHAVYKHFGMPVTKEFDDAMREYLAENPQGKHVKSRLDSKQMFGFTDTSILKAFEAVQTVDH